MDRRLLLNISISIVWYAVLESSFASSKLVLQTHGGTEMNTKPRISEQGARIRSIIFVSMGSGYCITGRDDWRGELPRYLVSFLSHATSVVISGRNKISKKSSCRPCLPDIINSGDNQTYECLDVLKTPPDLLVVFGSGAVVAELNECHNTSNWEVCARSNFPSLQLVKKSKLLSATTSIHFPVRQIPQLFQNPFRFVADNAVQMHSLTQFWIWL